MLTIIGAIFREGTNGLARVYQHRQRESELHGHAKLELQPKYPPSVLLTHRYSVRSGFITFMCESLYMCVLCNECNLDAH